MPWLFMFRLNSIIDGTLCVLPAEIWSHRLLIPVLSWWSIEKFFAISYGRNRAFTPPLSVFSDSVTPPFPPQPGFLCLLTAPTLAVFSDSTVNTDAPVLSLFWTGVHACPIIQTRWRLAYNRTLKNRWVQCNK